MEGEVGRGPNKFFRSKLLNLKTFEDEENLIREYKQKEEGILKDMYQIIAYSDVPISRSDLFSMTYREKEILIGIIKEKREMEEKNVK